MGKKLVSILAPVALAVLLIFADGCGAYNPSGTGCTSNCGGSSPGQAQGFYILQLQSGPALAALITPTDKFWGMLGTSSVNSFFVTGLASGQGASTTSGYNGTLTEIPSSGMNFTDVIAATDIADSSMSGTFTIGSAQTGMGGVALPSGSYTYDMAATVALITAVSPSWTGSLLDGTSVAITIDASGNILPLSTATGCQASGSVTPDSSNKNFYDVQLSFGQSPCSSAVAGLTVKGIGLFYLLPDGSTHQLLLAGTGGTSGGTVFFATH